MLDELYDDVFSIISENGFVQWFENNRYKPQDRNGGRISPLKWCYDIGGDLKTPKSPPKGITWVVNSYDNVLYHPYKCSIDDNGNIGPT